MDATLHSDKNTFFPKERKRIGTDHKNGDDEGEKLKKSCKEKIERKDMQHAERISLTVPFLEMDRP